MGYMAAVPAYFFSSRLIVDTARPSSWAISHSFAPSPLVRHSFSRSSMLRYYSFPISVLKISPLTPKFAQELEHSDYLGAIMNLGIERSLIGDILIKEKDAYVYCMNHIAEFITDNLTTVKHNHVRATVCDEIPDIIRPVLTEFEVIAASARIDAVVASITKLSRSSALEFFSAKKVFLNGINIENNSAQLKPGDILVIRGFGKFIFDGCGNETRKGRVYVHMRRY